MPIDPTQSGSGSLPHTPEELNPGLPSGVKSRLRSLVAGGLEPLIGVRPQGLEQHQADDRPSSSGQPQDTSAGPSGHSSPPTSPLRGPLEFSHRNRWRVGGQSPDLTITPALAAASGAIWSAIKSATTGRKSRSDVPEARAAFETPFPKPSVKWPKVTLKRRGEIKVNFAEDLPKSERKLVDPMRRAIQGTLRRHAGQPCTGATPHPASAGTLMSYGNGAMRWVGSASAAVPLAVYNVLQTHDADGEASQSLHAPPVELLTGVATVQAADGQRADYRLHDGALYRFQPGTRELGASWIGSGPAEEMRRHADGQVYVRQGDHLRALGPDGLGEPVLSGVSGWRSLQILPNTATGQGQQAVGIDPDGQAFLMGGGRPPELLPLAPDAVEIVPAGPGLLARTAAGELLPLRRDDQDLWQADPGHEIASAAQVLPLATGHHWQVQALGHAPDADGQAKLHALMVSDQGHRSTAIWTGADWRAQYAADGLEVVANQGLASKPLRPGSELRFDLDTVLAVGDDGSLCRHDPETQRFEAMLDANRQPLAGVKKIVTAAGGLHDGKTLLALAERDGRTEVLEVPLTGRIKKLPAEATRSWDTGSARWMQPELPGVGAPITRMASRGGSPEDELVDLAADAGGNCFALTRGGQVLQIGQSAVGSQVPWPRESAPVQLPGTEGALPAARIGGRELAVRQIAVSGDRGRLLALAQAPGAPLGLVEYRPGQPYAEGHWRELPLERPESISRTQWDGARLSTNLLGTPMIEVDGPEGPKRFRVLQRGASPTAPAAPPAPHMLVDASLSSEDPRIAMDRNDAWRLHVPGTRATIRQTWLGTSYNAVNARPHESATAIERAAHYGALPFKSIYENAVDGARLLQIPFMALKRARQDIWGRQELRRDYAVVSQAMQGLRELTPPLDAAQAARVRAAAAMPVPQARSEPIEAANALGEDALAHCRKLLEEMCITSRVLQPDRVSERSPGWRRQLQALAAAPINQLTINSQDGLPRIKQFLDDLARPEIGRSLPPREREQIDHLRHLTGLLERHDVKLWDGQRGNLSNFTAQHGSHAITGAALATSIDIYSRVVRTRADLQTAPDGEVDPAPQARSELIAQAERLQGDRSIELARCGFSGWSGLEALYESVHELRAQASASLGPSGVASRLYRMMEKDLDLPPRNKLPPDAMQALVPQKYAETVASLNPRSTYFWLRSTTAGVGANLGVGKDHLLTQLVSKAVSGVGLGANASIMGWRRTGIGVEALGTNDGTGQGPIIVFFQRASGVNASVGVSASVPPVPKQLRDMSVFANATSGWDESRARGAAMVLAPEQLQEFSRMLFDPSVDPVDLIKLGANQGGIGLNLQERSVTLLRGTAGVGERPPISGRQPTMFGTGQALSTSVNSGGGASLALAVEKRTMMLRLRLSFLPGGGIGDEYQGAFGPTMALSANANLPASLIAARTSQSTGALATSVTGARGQFDVAGAAINAAWQPTYKRTVDFLRAEPINQGSWDNLVLNLRQTEGLRLPMPPGLPPAAVTSLDVASDAGRAAMRACLHQWTDHLRRMEDAFTAHSQGEPLDDHRRELLAQANGVDEVHAMRLMLNGRRLLQQSVAAERGVALMEPSARIEFNLPSDNPTAGDTTAHARLGPAMALARQAETEIDGLSQIKDGNTRLTGFNQTRVVLTMHPRIVDLCNELIAFGVSRQECEREGIPWPENLPPGTDRMHFTYDDVRQMAERNPQNYGQVVLAAKNNEANVQSTSWSIGVPMAHTDIIAEERFLSEAAVRETGWGGRMLGAEVLPTGQSVLRRPGKEQQRLAAMGYRFEPPHGQQPARTLPMQPLDAVLHATGSPVLGGAEVPLEATTQLAAQSVANSSERNSPTPTPESSTRPPSGSAESSLRISAPSEDGGTPSPATPPSVEVHDDDQRSHTSSESEQTPHAAGSSPELPNETASETSQRSSPLNGPPSPPPGLELREDDQRSTTSSEMERARQPRRTLADLLNETSAETSQQGSQVNGPPSPPPGLELREDDQRSTTSSEMERARQPRRTLADLLNETSAETSQQGSPVNRPLSPPPGVSVAPTEVPDSPRSIHSAATGPNFGPDERDARQAAWQQTRARALQQLAQASTASPPPRFESRSDGQSSATSSEPVRALQPTRTLRDLLDESARRTSQRSGPISGPASPPNRSAVRAEAPDSPQTGDRTTPNSGVAPEGRRTRGDILQQTRSWVRSALGRAPQSPPPTAEPAGPAAEDVNPTPGRNRAPR